MLSPYQRPPLRHLLMSGTVAGLAFAMAFASGYLFGRADGAAGTGPLAALGGPVERVQTILSPASANNLLTEEEQRRFHVFWEAWGIVEKEFYNRGEIDHQKMIYGATKGMVDAVGDPHTAYLTPVNREISETDLRGSFDGVGIQVDMREGKLTVVSPIEGSPAEQAGIKPGDVVTAVDGVSLVSKTLNDTILMIRGERGTVVTLTVLRPPATDAVSYTLTRAEIRLDSVRSRMLDEGVGYIRISSFSSDTGTEAAASLRDLLTKQPSGLVVDLRSNPGGYLHAAVQVASQFMNDGVVLHQANGSGERQTYRADPGGLATGARLAVLVNKGTASASEILAAALHDNGRAVVIGEKTFGKGTVQNVHELSDRSGLRVTTAQWLTPHEQPLDKIGITPDILAPDPTDGTAGSDPQLEAAIRYLLGG